MLNRILKRLIDISLSIFGLIVLLPFFGFISLFIWIVDGGPIFFIQKRPGLNSEPFQMFKFRTMSNKTAPDGSLLPESERKTKWGNWLRKLSLDELPELLNVLKGDMSLVGPRPLLMEYLPHYTAEQARRHNVKPGITGWAQINGRNSITWEEKFKLDVWYVDHWNLWLDFKILALTILKTIKREGINASETLTMPKFKGSKHA